MAAEEDTRSEDGKGEEGTQRVLGTTGPLRLGAIRVSEKNGPGVRYLCPSDVPVARSGQIRGHAMRGGIKTDWRQVTPYGWGGRAYTDDEGAEYARLAGMTYGEFVCEADRVCFTRGSALDE